MSSDVLRAQRRPAFYRYERGALVRVGSCVLSSQLRRELQRIIRRRFTGRDVGLKIANVRVPSPIAVLRVVEVDERVGEPKFSIQAIFARTRRVEGVEDVLRGGAGVGIQRGFS